MAYFVRKYHESKRVTLDNSEAYQALVETGDAQQIEIGRRLLSNPSVEFFRLVGPALTEGRFAVSYVRVGGGSDFPDHSHDDIYACVYILEGRGHAIIDGNKHALEVGDVIYLPPGTVHVIVAEEGPLAYLACVSPDLGQDGKANITFR